MICDVSGQEAPPADLPATPPQEPRIRWWSRLSPWWWGLLMLLAILVVVATQVPRMAAITSAPRPEPTPAAPSAAATLAGPVYSQALVAGRDFADADLSGALLAHLDLRGKDFQYANAAGAVFADSLLNGVNFAHADLRGADLRDTCLRGAILTGAELAGADFTGADVTGATVTPTAVSAAIGWGSTPNPSVCLPELLPRHRQVIDMIAAQPGLASRCGQLSPQLNLSYREARSTLPTSASNASSGGTGLCARSAWKYT